MVGFDFRFSLMRQLLGGAGSVPPPNFVWLGNTLSAAPALTGAPAGATYMNPADTTFVTRNGIKMRSVGGGTTASNNAGFAGTPWWLMNSAFNGAEFEVAAGNWLFAIIHSGNVTGNTLKIVDNPAGVNVERQSIALTGASNSLSDQDGPTYNNAGTAVADVVNNLTFVPATISNAGGGVGIARVFVSGPGTGTISAIAFRPA